MWFPVAVKWFQSQAAISNLLTYFIGPPLSRRAVAFYLISGRTIHGSSLLRWSYSSRLHYAANAGVIRDVICRYCTSERCSAKLYLTVTINYDVKAAEVWGIRPKARRVTSHKSRAAGLISLSETNGILGRLVKVVISWRCIESSTVYIIMCMLNHWPEWYKWLLTNFDHDRQWFNTLVPLSHESAAVAVFHAWVDPWG